MLMLGSWTRRVRHSGLPWAAVGGACTTAYMLWPLQRQKLLGCWRQRRPCAPGCRLLLWQQSEARCELTAGPEQGRGGGKLLRRQQA